MSIRIEEKPEPRPLHRRSMRQLVAYQVVGVPDSEADDRKVIHGISLGDVVVCFEGVHSTVLNCTQEKLVHPHQANSGWDKYTFRRARLVSSITLTFDPDED